MSEFIKLFDSTNYGQICVIKGEGSEDIPYIEFIFRDKLFGVYRIRKNIVILRDEIFSQMTVEKAEKTLVEFYQASSDEDS